MLTIVSRPIVHNYGHREPSCYIALFGPFRETESLQIKNVMQVELIQAIEWILGLGSSGLITIEMQSHPYVRTYMYSQQKSYLICFIADTYCF